MSQINPGASSGGSGAPVLPIVTGITASTTLTQGGGTPITSQYTQVTNPATNTHAAVTLPSNATLGAIYIIERINSAGGNSLYIFPQASAQIDTIGINTALQLQCYTASPDAAVMLVATTSTTWKVIGLVGGFVGANSFANNIGLSVGNLASTGTTTLSTASFNGVATFGAIPVHKATTGITAHAGGGQASAVALVSELCVIATCASGGDSVVLPTPTTGNHITVINNGAASCDVFPLGTNAIDALGASNQYALANGVTREFWAVSSTLWNSKS